MNYLGQVSRIGVATTIVCATALAGMITSAEATAKAKAEYIPQQICQSVIRVRPGVSEFDGCVSSLTDTVQRIGYDDAVVQARHACFGSGLTSGSTDLDLCLLRATQVTPDADAVELPDAISAMAALAHDPKSVESYFTAASSVRHDREQQSCALLGLDPAFGAFANCVTSLQDSLEAADAPPV